MSPLANAFLHPEIKVQFLYARSRLGNSRLSLQELVLWNFTNRKKSFKAFESQEL